MELRTSGEHALNQVIRNVSEGARAGLTRNDVRGTAVELTQRNQQQEMAARSADDQARSEAAQFNEKRELERDIDTAFKKIQSMPDKPRKDVEFDLN